VGKEAPVLMPSDLMPAAVIRGVGEVLTVPRPIQAGVVWINAHGCQPEFSAPQGGLKQSRFDEEMGCTGIEAYLRHNTLWYAHG
jgi:acyl-CoA reductase-like NAD-dependent aldehyde dehydrogenase